MRFLRYLPVLIELSSYLDAATADAKANDGKIDGDEAFELVIGFIAVFVEKLFPWLPAEKQLAIKEAVMALAPVRDRVENVYATATDSLYLADRFYQDAASKLGLSR